MYTQIFQCYSNPCRHINGLLSQQPLKVVLVQKSKCSQIANIVTMLGHQQASMVHCSTSLPQSKCVFSILTHTHTCTHTHVHTHTHACVFKYTHMHTCVHTHAHTHTHNAFLLCLSTFTYSVWNSWYVFCRALNYCLCHCTCPTNLFNKRLVIGSTDTAMINISNYPYS